MKKNNKVYSIAFLISFLYIIGFECYGIKSINRQKMEIEKREIYLAGGCFWGVEHFVKQIPGVLETEVGYANSKVKMPTYKEVCSGKTGAAETVKVTYDATRLALSFLLEKYFLIINPTLQNRQGNDIGTQYRTGIFYTDETDREIINKALKDLQSKYSAKILVENNKLENFFSAENYHQDYLDVNPGGYCHVAPEMFNEAKKAVCPKTYLRNDNELREKFGKISHDRFQRPNDADLKQQLSELQYKVVRENATEAPYTNEYWKTEEAGIYVDIVTGEPLFCSNDKFTSECGWPAFSKPIKEKLVREKIDTSHGMHRIEIRSIKGDAHLGHVFEDGPKEKGGRRYCVNSSSLKFIPKSKMEQEGYGEWLNLFE